MSKIQQHKITVGTTEHNIVLTVQQTENDINGNPMYLFQVWTKADNGCVWYPKLKGLRERKDNTYKVQSFNLYHTIESFLILFERELNERL